MSRTLTAIRAVVHIAVDAGHRRLTEHLVAAAVTLYVCRVAVAVDEFGTIVWVWNYPLLVLRPAEAGKR